MRYLRNLVTSPHELFCLSLILLVISVGLWIMGDFVFAIRMCAYITSLSAVLSFGLGAFWITKAEMEQKERIKKEQEKKSSRSKEVVGSR